MIFADKLIQLRKKNGWSQEELANQMNVTRQSVSKWEGAQSIPDLEKILKLSELFGVSTDYLLKDELEETEQGGFSEDIPSARSVSIEEACDFLRIKEASAKRIAYGVFLCIMSPISLFILEALSETPGHHLSTNAAGGIGMIILLALVAFAAVIFISTGSQTAPYGYLEKENFETAYGVSGMVKERKERYKNKYTRNNLIGTSLCILSLSPLFIGTTINEDSELLGSMMLSTMFVFVGIGVIFFVQSGIIWASYEKLLQEGGYSKKKKEKRKVMASVSTVYWLVATAIFLAYSLTTNGWEYSWIVWVLAGVLYPALLALIRIFEQKKEEI